MARPNTDFTPFPDDLYEQAFVIWLHEADRSPTRTAELLRIHEEQIAALDDRPPRKTPNPRTIWRWARHDDWDVRAQEYFALHAPDWYHRNLGRTLMQLDRGMVWMDLLLRPPGDPEAEAAFKGVKPDTLLQERLKAIRDHRETLGVGMFGQKAPRPDIPLPQGTSDGAEKTAYERALRTAQKAKALEGGS